VEWFGTCIEPEKEKIYNALAAPLKFAILFFLENDFFNVLTVLPSHPLPLLAWSSG
jgi:hypothetical protein